MSFEEGITEERVSGETIRSTLKRLGVRWERAKRWITSPDPEYERKKGLVDRLIRLALSRPEWALGFEDETWWSRFERPSLHSWAEWGQPMPLIDKEAIKGDTDPKALAAYGMLVRTKEVDGQVRERTWLRFVDGRPVSSITTQFLEYSCQKLAAIDGQEGVAYDLGQRQLAHK